MGFVGFWTKHILFHFFPSPVVFSVVHGVRERRRMGLDRRLVRVQTSGFLSATRPRRSARVRPSRVQDGPADVRARRPAVDRVRGDRFFRRRRTPRPRASQVGHVRIDRHTRQLHTIHVQTERAHQTCRRHMGPASDDERGISAVRAAQPRYGRVSLGLAGQVR